jgi:transcriptional regulator with XRE-family HTH domain
VTPSDTPDGPRTVAVPDSDADTVERFASDLRALRQAAGNPTLAALDRRSGISKSVLSDALSGRVLPTERTVEGLTRALDADVRLWAERRRRLDPGPRVARPGAGPRPATVRRRTAIALAVGCSVLAAAATLVAARAAWDPAVTVPEGPRYVVANGTDPATTPCVDDAAVVASETRERDTQLQIVYSEACHAAWARITRYDDASAGNAVSAGIYRQIAPEAADRQDTTEPDAQSAYTTLLVRETPETRLCASGSITVDGARIDLDPPVCV